MCLLERGLTFIPIPKQVNKNELRRDLHLYHRRIKLIHYFQNSTPQAVPFTLPSSWEPTWEQLDDRVRELIGLDRRCLNSYVLPHVAEDVSEEDGRIIKELHSQPNIVVKPADKGSKIVIMDKQQYSFEANRQLNDAKYYKPIPDSLQQQTQAQIRTIVQELYHPSSYTNIDTDTGLQTVKEIFNRYPDRTRSILLQIPG